MPPSSGTFFPRHHHFCLARRLPGRMGECSMLWQGGLDDGIACLPLLCTGLLISKQDVIALGPWGGARGIFHFCLAFQPAESMHTRSPYNDIRGTCASRLLSNVAHLFPTGCLSVCLPA